MIAKPVPRKRSRVATVSTKVKPTSGPADEKPEPAVGAKRVAKPKVSRREIARKHIRERLVSAALTAFAEQGYSGASIERIVELADTTAPTFYRHFNSKRDMLEPLREHLVEEVGAVFRRLDTGRQQTPDSVKMWLREYIEMWRNQRRLCEAHWEAVAADAEFAADTLNSSLLIVDTLKKFFGRFPVASHPTMRLRMALIMVLLDRVVHLARDERDAEQSDAILDQFAEMFWLSIYSDSARASLHVQDNARTFPIMNMGAMGAT